MFHSRSTQKELLDAESIPRNDLFQNLKELNIINQWLGGHRVTLVGLEKLRLNPSITCTILDVGSGGGDTLKAIADWGRKKNLSLRLVGVDLKKECIEYATAYCISYPEISFIQSDYREIDHLNLNIDIVTSALFCHHLMNEEITALMEWSLKNAQYGVIMNDLHRHPIAYYSIALLTSFFSKSYLVKNDAKLSVLRGFNRSDILNCLQSVPKPQQSLTWEWAFRWLLVIQK